MKTRKNVFLIIILLLAIGFAAISTNLIIKNNILIGTNIDDFDVYFSSAKIDSKDESASIISSDGKTINFKTNDLKSINDTSVLDYEITNNSSQYDAKVSINCTDVDADYIEIKNILINDVIKAKSTSNGNLNIKLLKSVVIEEEIELTCELNVTALERESVGISDEIYEPGEASTYSIYGYLIDENEEILANKNLVVYSSTPHYVTTDAYGYFYVEGLEKGSHEIYYIDTNIGENKSKSEIEKIAIDKVNITTSTKNITFEKGTRITDSVIEKTKNVTYLLDFETNGGEINETKQVTHNNKYGNLPIPTKEGYTFIHWEDEEKRIITEDIIVSKNDVHTLYAKWTPNTYTVTYNANGATSGSTASSGHIYDEEKNLTLNGFSRSYKVTYNANGGSVSTASANAPYTFSGWATSSSGSVEYTDKQSVKNLSSTDGATVNLYAIWSGGKLSSLPTPTRDGYTFNGWYTSASGGTKITTSTVFTKATTVYAQWTLNKYAIGTVVTIGSEKFNIISQTDNTVKLYAKYALGPSHKQLSSTTVSDYAVTFGTGSGWEYQLGQKSIDIQKWSTNPKTYINDYVSYLKTQTNDSTIKGDLITVEELKELNCTLRDNFPYTGVENCNDSKYSSWLVNGQYWWTKSVYTNQPDYIWKARPTGELYYSSYSNGNGIRPTIIISKAALV